jgi:hypothetical protein
MQGQDLVKKATQNFDDGSNTDVSDWRGNFVLRTKDNLACLIDNHHIIGNSLQLWAETGAQCAANHPGFDQQLPSYLSPESLCLVRPQNLHFD